MSKTPIHPQPPLRSIAQPPATPTNWVLRRLSEPSTWAGVALVVSHAAAAVATRNPADIAAVFGGLAAMLAKEGSK